MNKLKFLSLFLVLLSVTAMGHYFISNYGVDTAQDEVTAADQINADHTILANSNLNIKDNVNVVSASTSKIGPGNKSATDVQDKIEKDLEQEYEREVVVLAQLLDQYKLDIDELNRQASEKSFDEFIKTLPAPVRKGYQALHAVINKIQKLNMNKDGIDNAFFGQYQVQEPAWLTERKSELANVVLPGHVEKLVQAKSNEKEIVDSDVKEVLKACGKGNRNCIEKAVLVWIDANHALTSGQHEMIKGYL